MKLDLPYLTVSLPGIGGCLRANSDHFVVEEIPLYEPLGEGQHLYVNLTKRNRTTKHVQRDLARILGIRLGAIGFAGLKDKHAVTTQTFSLDFGPLGTRRQQDVIADAVARIQESSELEVHWARFHRNKLKPGHLLGNRFRVAVSDLALGADEALHRAQAIASRIGTDGLPNYFGPQRFGQKGDNVERGRAILQGESVRVDRWLRKFLVSAYQSYLCNRYLALRIERGLFKCVVDGDVAKKYATGGMFEVENVPAEQVRFDAHEISHTAPIFGPKMWDSAREAFLLEKAVLESQPIMMEEFARVKAQGTRRLGRLLVTDLVVNREDDLLILQFSLPKGAFATTVLREFTKAPDFDVQNFDDEA